MDKTNVKAKMRRNSDSLSDPANLPGRKPIELTDLLTACRELTNILDPNELYMALADLLRDKFALRTLAIFVYHEQSQTFEQVNSYGLGTLNLTLQRDEWFPWDHIIQNDPFPVADAEGKSLFPEFFKNQNLDELNSELWVPLVVRDEVVGLLTLGENTAGKPFDDFDHYFLKQIAAQSAVCMNTCRLYAKRQKEKEDLDKTLQNLSLLYSIGKAMNYISDLKNLLQYILGQAIEITSAEKGSIMLYDLESDRLNIRVLAGMADTDYQDKVNSNEIECRSFKPGEGIAGRVFVTAKPMVVNDIQDEDLFVRSETSYVESIVCIPMVVYSDVIGVINVTNKKTGEGFTDEDVRMLRAVADQAAVAVNKAQLWDMAVTDSLTGLYVRRYFMVRLQEEIHRADRYNKILSLIMVDLDGFKSINDTYGHDAGDRALQGIAKFLQNDIRDVDTVARYGGEEFIMLIPDADKEAAFCMAERLREKLAEFRVDGFPQITISLGIASYPDDGTEIQDLIKKSDVAMYAAKQAGRNKTVKYSSDIKSIQENSAIN